MKKRVGVLYGKPVIVGDENLCTKNEIHVNSLKGGGEPIQNKSIIKQYYYKVHRSLLFEDNWVLNLINQDPNIGDGENSYGILITYHLIKMTSYASHYLFYKPGSIMDISGSTDYERIFYKDYFYIMVLYNNNAISDDTFMSNLPEDFKELLKMQSNLVGNPIEDIDVLEESSYEEHMEAWNYAVEKFKEEHINE